MALTPPPPPPPENTGPSLPPLPLDASYTNCYCEENVYLLARTFLASPAVIKHWDISAVFISNPARSVALWRQRAAAGGPGPVVWDYHVVLVLRGEGGHSAVYDFDTMLDPVPCGSRHYLEKTFPYAADSFAVQVPEDPRYHSMFRIVPASEFVDNFASDRSHMLVQDEQVVPGTSYLPPSYAPLQGSTARELGIRHNLMTDFVDMEARGFGTVVDLGEFKSWCTVSS